jgi:dTDP-4-dehydrorhamnose reductase
MKYKVAVLGAQGFLGESLIKGLSKKHSVFGTTRTGKYGHILTANSSDQEIYSIFNQLLPGALIINTIGKLAHHINELNSEDVKNAKIVNEEFPQRLYKLASAEGLRLIQISTDAVFSNMAGNVDETSLANPQNVYGKTKLSGEIIGKHALTIRCSFIGPTVGLEKKGIWSWIMGLKYGEIINGFQNQLWSGVTTNQLIFLFDLLVDIKNFHKAVSVSSIHHFCPNAAITKYELVSLITRHTRPDIVVLPTNSEVTITRKLVSKFNILNKFIYQDNCNWSLLISSLVNKNDLF